MNKKASESERILRVWWGVVCCKNQVHKSNNEVHICDFPLTGYASEAHCVNPGEV